MTRYHLKPHTYLTIEPGATAHVFKLRVLIPIPAGHVVESIEPNPESPADSFPPNNDDEFRTIVIKVKEQNGAPTSLLNWTYLVHRRDVDEKYILVRVCQGSCNGADEKGVRISWYADADTQVLDPFFQPHIYLTRRIGESNHTLFCLIPYTGTPKTINPSPPAWPTTRPTDGRWKSTAVITSTAASDNPILFSQHENFLQTDVIEIQVENGGVKGKGIVRAKDSDNKPWL